MGSSVLRVEDWPAYLGTAASAVVGVAIGSSMRSRVDAETILRGLYCLLLVSALTMFDVVGNTLAIALYAGCLAVYILLVTGAHHFASLPELRQWLRAGCGWCPPTASSYQQSVK
jgi:hypothetical protein